MTDVFLSYAREDVVTVAKLAAALEAASISVWWDQNLTGGARYLKTTEAELNAAKAVVVVWTKHSIDSHWVADEAMVGRDEGRLVPISLDGSSPPLGFRQFQTIDFSGWKGGQDEALARLISALGGQSAVKPPTAAPAFNWKRWGLPSLLAAAVIAAVALFAMLMSQGPGAAAPKAATFAILPFEALDDDPASVRLARSISVDIARELTASGGSVQSLASTAPYVGAQKGKAGQELDAKILIDGTVSRQDDKVSVTINAIHAKTGLALWTTQVEGDPDDPSLTGLQVASRVAWSLTWGGAEQVLSSNAPNAAELSRAWLRVLQEQQESNDLQAALAAAGKLRELAPESALGDITTAISAINLVPTVRDMRERRRLFNLAREAATSAAAKSDSGDGVFLAEMLVTPPVEWKLREDVMNRGKVRYSKRGAMTGSLAQIHLNAGRLAEANAGASAAAAAEPSSPMYLGRVAMLAVMSGDTTGNWRKLLDETDRRWPNEPLVNLSRLQIAVWTGSPEEAAAELKRAPGWGLPVETVALLEDFVEAQRLRTPASVRKVVAACGAHVLSEPSDLALNCFLATAILGELSEAFNAAEVVFPRQTGDSEEEIVSLWLESPTVLNYTYLLFLPRLAALRADVRIIPVFERTGLLKYWRETGQWPDFCESEPQSVCAKMKAR